MYDFLFGPDRDPVADPGTSSGTPGDWWTVFALVPPVFDHAVGGFVYCVILVLAVGATAIVTLMLPS